MAFIIIVEDDVDIRDLITMRLEHAHHEVAVAGNGREGVDLCLERRPDLVVMDVMMPVMSGLDAVAELRRTSRLCDVPIIMLSAGSLDAERSAGTAEGADVYVSKPFSLAVLTDTVAELLARPGRAVLADGSSGA